VRIDAERVALAVEVRQRDDDRHQPRRRDHLQRPRLAREDLRVDRMHHRVEPATTAPPPPQRTIHINILWNILFKSTYLCTSLKNFYAV